MTKKYIQLDTNGICFHELEYLGAKAPNETLDKCRLPGAEVALQMNHGRCRHLRAK